MVEEQNSSPLLSTILLRDVKRHLFFIKRREDEINRVWPNDCHKSRKSSFVDFPVSVPTDKKISCTDEYDS